MHRSATAKVPTRPMAKLTPIVVAIGFALYQSSPALGEAPDKKTEAYQNLPSMSWPVLPGENLNQLAKLFYPKNKAMQKRFIEASIVLSKEINPNLKPQTAYRQPSSIMIPELEALSAMAKKSDGKQKRLRMSYRIASVPLEEVTPEMEKEYEELAARNEKAKVELEQLNRRLAELQIRLEKLKEAAQKWLEQQAKLEAQKNEAALNSANTLTQNPAEPVPSLQAPQQPDAKPAPAKPAKVKKAAKQTEPVEVEDSLSNKLEQLWVPSLMFLLAALVALLYVFRKRLPFKNVFSESKPINLDTDQPRVTSNDSVLEIVKGNNTLNEERISSVTEDARRLFNKGKTDEALELLNDAINFSAKRSITTWLYLLDLYRTLDKRIEFERLADRFHKNFNVMAPLWNPVEVNVVVANSLEDFPHVLEELQLHWQKGDADIFLDTLISDNRDGERTGFSLAVLEEIMLLKDIWQNKDYLFDQDSFDKDVFDKESINDDGFDEDGLPILKK